MDEPPVLETCSDLEGRRKIFKTSELFALLKDNGGIRLLKPFFENYQVILACEPVFGPDVPEEQGLSFSFKKEKDLLTALRQLENLGLSSKPYVKWAIYKSPADMALPIFIKSAQIIDPEVEDSTSPSGDNHTQFGNKNGGSTKEYSESTQSFLVQIDGSPTLQLTNRERSKTVTIFPKLPEKIGAGWPLVAKPRASSSPAKLASAFSKKDLQFRDQAEVEAASQNESKNEIKNRGLFENNAVFTPDGTISPDDEKSVYKVPQRRVENIVKKIPKLKVDTGPSVPTKPPSTQTPSIKIQEKPIGNTLMFNPVLSCNNEVLNASQWGPYVVPTQYPYLLNSPQRLSGGYPEVKPNSSGGPIFWQNSATPEQLNWPGIATGVSERPMESRIVCAEHPRFERSRPPVGTFGHLESPRRFLTSHPRSSPKKPDPGYIQQSKNNKLFIFDENKPPGFYKDQARAFAQSQSMRYQSIQVDNSSQQRDQIKRVRGVLPRFAENVHEDHELCMENAMPYRLRAPPLTGPKCIR